MERDHEACRAMICGWNSMNAVRTQLRGQQTVTTQQIAEQAAQLLLCEFRESHAWWQDDYVPLDELVAWLGLNVELFNVEAREPGTYGYVDPDDDEHLIWLRHNLAPSIRRFTLAHELGHVVLHCRMTAQLETLLSDMRSLLARTRDAEILPFSDEDVCQEDDVADTSAENEERLQDRLGIGQSYNPRSLREQAANMFASELLMPLERVRTLYGDAHINPHNAS